MYPATCELLERLADLAQATLRSTRDRATDLTARGAAALEIADLDQLLDKARHELKGGARHV